MARNVQTQVVDQQAAIDQIIAQLRQPKSNVSLFDRITNYAVDSVADSGNTVSRFAAAAASAVDNFGDAYEQEKERQLRRRAEKILAAYQAQ